VVPEATLYPNQLLDVPFVKVRLETAVSPTTVRAPVTVEDEEITPPVELKTPVEVPPAN
jgi:hypothetical protein